MFVTFKRVTCDENFDLIVYEIKNGRVTRIHNVNVFEAFSG